MTQGVVFLLNHLWQSTLVAGLAWLACRTFLKSNSPRIRFGVWAAVSVKFLVPFALLVETGRRAGVHPLGPVESQQVLDIVRGSGALTATPFQAALAPPAATSSQSVLLTTLLIVWALGAVVVLSRWARQSWRVRSLALDAAPAGTFRGAPVRISRRMRDEQIEPGVVGLWRQAILIPEGVDARLTASQLQAVLAHEWHHVQRRDNALAALHTLAEAAFWFHPVVWFIRRRLIEEREMACDQAVLEEADADDYAEGILNVCKFYCHASGSLVAGMTSADLRTRIAWILRTGRPRQLDRVRRWALGAALSAAVAGPLIGGLLSAPIVFAQGNSFVGMATSAEKRIEVATIKVNDSASRPSQAQQPADQPRVEAATIKPQTAPGPVIGGVRAPDVFSRPDMTLRYLLVYAYALPDYRIVGGPSWIDSARFDVLVKTSSVPTAEQMRQLVREFLEARFSLKTRRETREQPIYELVLARSDRRLGPKLTPAAVDCTPFRTGQRPLSESPIVERDGISFPRCGSGAMMSGQEITPRLNGIAMSALADYLERSARRHVVDKTALKGVFDVELTYVDESLGRLAGASQSEGPALLTAVQEQLGLKLEPARAPVDILVIEHIERPSEN